MHEAELKMGAVRKQFFRRFLLTYFLVNLIFLGFSHLSGAPIILAVHLGSIGSVIYAWLSAQGIDTDKRVLRNFIVINFVALSVNLALNGGQILSIHNVWFPLFIFLAYLMLGRKAGLASIICYILLICAFSLVRYLGYNFYAERPFDNEELILFTPLAISIFSLLFYLCLNAFSEMRGLMEQGLMRTLEKEKITNQTLVSRENKLLTTITELEEIKTKLEATTYELNQAQKLARIGGFEFNVATGKATWTEHTAQLFGLPEGTDMATIDFPTLVEPGELKRIRDNRRLLEETLKPVRFSFRVKHSQLKDPIYLELVNHPVLDGEGKLVSVKGSLRDSTVETLYNQRLISDKEDAEAANKAKALFLSTMSHEIRTPMNAVIGFVQLLLLDDPRPDQLENLQTLDQAARHLLSLINDILDFEKIEANKIDLEEVPLNLTELIRQNLRLFKNRAEEKGLTLKTDISIPENQVVLGDTVRLSQVLNNLMGNAIKFTEAGGVALSADTRPGPAGQIWLVVRVADTGVGIPENKLEAIFEHFSQASNDITRRYGGTGLGLSISRRLAEIMGGQITVTSALGAGSVFEFRVPLKPAGSSAKAHPGKLLTTTKHLEKTQLLLVEDNPVNVMLARKCLNRMGITHIEVAENGLVALNLLDEKSFDLILMDLQMPVMDGITATHCIRQSIDPVRARTPIIALTASASADVADRILTAGMNGYATKPFIIEELKELITKTLKEGESVQSA